MQAGTDARSGAAARRHGEADTVPVDVLSEPGTARGDPGSPVPGARGGRVHLAFDGRRRRPSAGYSTSGDRTAPAGRRSMRWTGRQAATALR